MSARVTVGVPTFERPQSLARCLAALSAQTYPALDIVVADNASTDPEVRRVLDQACALNPRVKVILRLENIGAAANFADLLVRADTPYFIWAANDDYLAPDAIETLVGLLDRHPAASMACGAVRPFNGDTVAAPFIFTEFSSTSDRMSDLSRFLYAPEIEGKANPIYGLFRTEAAKDAARAVALGTRLRSGEDVIFNFAFLCRHDMVATDKPLLFKHTASRRADRRPRFFSSDYSFPRRAFAEYRDGLVEACATDEQRTLVREVMRRRWLWKVFVSSWRKPLFYFLS